MECVRVDVKTDMAEPREHIRRIEAIEVALSNLNEKLDRAQSAREIPTFTDPDTSVSDAHNDEGDHIRHRVYKPAIRHCDFVHFKNYFDEDDASYACDVLFSDSLSGEDRIEDQRLRDRLDEYAMDGSQASRRRALILTRENEKTSRALRNDQLEPKWIQRIRIQSPFLIETLSRLHGESWPNIPRVYDRPFCTLVHYHDSMVKVLSELEEQDQQANGPLLASDGGHVHAGADANTPRESLDEAHANLEILKAYVAFIDKEVLPEARRYKKMTYKDRGTIRFTDLCYLFSPGEILYRPAEGEKVGENRRSRVGQRLWKITGVNEPNKHEVPSSMGHHASASTDSEFADLHRNDFVVHAFHVDFTGEEFCVVEHSFVIPPFQGQKVIKHLPVFPRRFAADCDSFCEEATAIGEKVLSHLETKHAFYDDWTVTRSPQDGDVIDETGKALRHPEPINSEVIVDFREAFQFNPNWQPARSVIKAEVPVTYQINDPFPLRRWSGKDRARLLYEVKEIIPFRTAVHGIQRNEFVTNDRFLKIVALNDQIGRMTTAKDIELDEKQLLHCRVFAYIFRDRKFAQLDAGALKHATRSRAALDALKIPENHKAMIQRSVEGYFISKRHRTKNRDSRKSESASADIIPGKGSGLFLLLHGAPGVGKTMTAEAIAQANGKPLFKITCGDIGLTPAQVETSLRGIFRLASVWDCILLMDEVDTFFSQRSKGDNSVTKNALVSVFLRVLDYYEGILFLTTNRAGTLDEAFKSRIHYKIYYNILTKRQSLDIWRHNIERLRVTSQQMNGQRQIDIRESDIMDFADEQFELANRQGHPPWSGRQIRNAFQVAKSLAFYDAETNTSGESTTYTSAVLTRDYFQMMSNITQDFDNYMKRIHGMNDTERAREMEHRADDFGQMDDNARNEMGGSISRQGGARSPLDFELMTEQRGPSYSQSRGSRPMGTSILNPRASTEFLQPGTSHGFDDSGRAGQASPGIRPRQYDMYDNDPYRNSASSARTTSTFGRSSDRPFSSGMPDSRDARRQSDFERDQNYVDIRNEHGKRHRMDS